MITSWLFRFENSAAYTATKASSGTPHFLRISLRLSGPVPSNREKSTPTPGTCTTVPPSLYRFAVP